METLSLTPPKYAMKKRPFDFIDMNNGTSPQESMHSASSSSTAWHESSKRSRFLGNSNNDENMSPFDSMKAGSSSDVFKRYDPSMFGSMSNPSTATQPFPSYPKQTYIDPSTATQIYQESYISSIKDDYEKKLHQKDEQIMNILRVSKQLHDTNTRLEHDSKLLVDENKLLKKAFGIQDQRQREVLDQNQKYQHMIQQMSDYLQNLEQVTYQLREELRNREIQSSGGNHTYFHPPPPPPDVF